MLRSGGLFVLADIRLLSGPSKADLVKQGRISGWSSCSPARSRGRPRTTGSTRRTRRPGRARRRRSRPRRRSSASRPAPAISLGSAPGGRRVSGTGAASSRGSSCEPGPTPGRPRAFGSASDHSWSNAARGSCVANLSRSASRPSWRTAARGSCVANLSQSASRPSWSASMHSKRTAARGSCVANQDLALLSSTTAAERLRSESFSRREPLARALGPFEAPLRERPAGRNPRTDLAHGVNNADAAPGPANDPRNATRSLCWSVVSPSAWISLVPG